MTWKKPGIFFLFRVLEAESTRMSPGKLYANPTSVHHIYSKLMEYPKYLYG